MTSKIKSTNCVKLLKKPRMPTSIANLKTKLSGLVEVMVIALIAKSIIDFIL